MGQVTPDTKAAITFAEFQASKEYLACTPKMQVWLTTLIESNFDYKLATATAFNCKNLRQAHVFSYAVRKWPIIRTALNLYLGLSEQDVFMADLQETIRRAPKGSDRHVRALALYARLKFGVAEGSAEPQQGARTTDAPATVSEVSQQRFHVGQIITDRDDHGVVHTGRVIAVDANGQLLDVEEIPS
jgi:hypothetical protein